MKIMDYLHEVQKLKEKLKLNSNIELNAFQININGKSGKGNFSSSMVPLDLLEFYQTISSIKMDWFNSLGMGEDVSGTLKILPLKNVLNSWKGDIYFDDDEGKLISFFHPVDFFIQESCVGIILNNKDQWPGLYFHSLGDELIPLNLNFEGYFKLMLEARGFLYWQLSIVSTITNYQFEEALRFKKSMPKIFKEFNWDRFINLYDNLKI